MASWEIREQISSKILKETCDYCIRVCFWRKKASICSPFNVYNNWDMIILSYCEAGCKLDHFCEFHLQVNESTSADSGRHTETWGKTPRPRIHLVLPQLVQWSWQLMDCFSFPCKWSRTGGKHVVLCYKNRHREREFTLLQTRLAVKWRERKK